MERIDGGRSHQISHTGSVLLSALILVWFRFDSVVNGSGCSGDVSGFHGDGFVSGCRQAFIDSSTRVDHRHGCVVHCRD